MLRCCLNFEEELDEQEEERKEGRGEGTVAVGVGGGGPEKAGGSAVDTKS